MTDSPSVPAKIAALARVVDRDLNPWQMRIIDDIMRLPGRDRDPAYRKAAARCRDCGRGATPLRVFFDEVAAYYIRAPRLSRMHAAYHSRMKARRRRG